MKSNKIGEKLMNFILSKKRISILFCVMLFSVVGALQVFAQSATSSVSGTISDAQGNVVTGATVKIVNVEKGFSRTAATTSNGVFNFQSVPPDTYSVEVEASGFKKSVRTNVIALVDKPTDASITLEVGNVTEVVTVTADAIESIVNTQDASLGNNFVAKQILELPLEGRNVADLLSLQPAVTTDGSVAGGRSDQANITLDGADVNDQQNGTAFVPVLRVTPDSVEEFRVTTTNADASKGRSAGAQISLSVKSGTNDFRGALYEYHRPTETTANDFFNNLNGVERPKLVRNLFGGRLGGPIIKNRLFFFYNYEALRETREIGVTRVVPLPNLGQGSVRFFNNSGGITTLTAAQINALTSNGQSNGAAVVDVNPIALATLADAARRYPANDFTVGDGLNTAGFRFNAKIPQTQNTHTARFDWRVRSDESQTVTFRSIFQDDSFDAPSAFPDTPSITTTSRPFGTVVAHNWVIKSNLINNLRYGYTRQSFSNNSDATDDTITFRAVFAPRLFARAFARQTDTQNITDDVSWVKGNHSFQFGTNIRVVRNQRSNELTLTDLAVVNRSFFSGSGSVLTNPIVNSGFSIRPDFILSARDAVASVLGRFSQFTVNTNFGLDGRPLADGVPVVRKFATEEYDVYFQDQWKASQNLTITAGLRYGLSRPVYERQGYQSKPEVSLQEYLDRRIAAANQGQNSTEPLVVNLAGPANNAENAYPWDKNNFQPRIAVAWSPNFKSGFLRTLFGADSASVFRGGFAITNDYFGQALAVNFDANNTIGFTQATTVPANSFNVTTRPGPLYTGASQNIGGLTFPPGITVPNNLSFPVRQLFDDQRRIEGSLDSNLVSPINYQWNFTYGRKLPVGLYVETSYIGRLARNLLATRDVMTPNNIRDPRSGQTWYEAANILENLRRNRTPISQIPVLPFFENLYPAGSLGPAFHGGLGAGLTNTQAAYSFMATTADTQGCAALQGCFDSGTDWTFLQDVLDQVAPDIGASRLFYQRQYGALSAFGTIGSSDYHGATLSIRQRFKSLSWDLNYTFSKSFDDSSGLQVNGVFGAGFILNALRQDDNRAVSDFDVRHIVNFNSIWELPIGRDRTFFSNMPKVLDAVLGGWQLSNIFRYNTGVPVDGFVDINGWPTNWNVRSRVVRIKNIKASPSKNVNGSPNLFSDPTAAYRSFRSPAPGETGDRNALRGPSFIVLDLGLAKSFKLPWNENHLLQLRWDTFNVTNTQRFDGNSAADTTFGLDPDRNGSPGPNFGTLTAIQGAPRIMQFAIRYDF